MPSNVSYDAVIIGSGFGGAVTALRLARAGKSVCILERGKKYPKGSFPRTYEELLRTILNKKDDDLIDLRVYKDINVVIGSGVGGGSLIYANVHYLPEEHIFTEGHFPKKINNRKALEPYYKLVADMLRGVPADRPYVNEPFKKSEAMEEIARRLGKAGDLKKVNLAIYFGNPNDTSHQPEEVPDPFGRGGPPQAGCVHCAWCPPGCNIHAKNTLDLNYLWFAENKCGAKIFPQTKATKIVPLGDPPGSGGYDVHFLEGGNESTTPLHGESVILAAGVLGSTELLLRCKYEYKTLPAISDALGLHFSGNADFLAGITSPNIPVESTHGPTITRSIEFNDKRFLIEDAGFPKELARIIESAAGLSGGTIRSHFKKPIADIGNQIKELFNREPGENLLLLLLMGEDASDGRIVLKDNGELDIQWENEMSMSVFNAMVEAVEKMARTIGGEAFFNPEWTVPRKTEDKKLTTVHPLGGCPMADDYTGGVVDDLGRVFNVRNGYYPGLYVADGSIIPKAVGKNPSMTIAALAERISFWMIHGREMQENDRETPSNQFKSG